MKKLTPLLILMACNGGGESSPVPETYVTDVVNGVQHYMVHIPVNEDANPQSITGFDRFYIKTSGVCPNGFQDVSVEYAPFFDDKVATKNITFYCLGTETDLVEKDAAESETAETDAPTVAEAEIESGFVDLNEIIPAQVNAAESEPTEADIIEDIPHVVDIFDIYAVES